MKVNKAVRELTKLKRKVASLEASIQRGSAEKLKSDRKKIVALVRKLGYKSVDHLFSAPDGIVALVPVAPIEVRNRAKITTAIRKSIAADLKTGGQSSADIAKKHKVSVATIANIKRDLGLTRSRKAKKKPVKTAAAKKKPKVAIAVPAAAPETLGAGSV